MAKLVVTGGDGFIGSHLVDALVERGDEVHIIDTCIANNGKNLNKKAIHHHVDIRDFSAIRPIFNQAQFVFHLAALPRIQPSIENPSEYHDTNVTGTLNVLRASRDAKVKRVIFSSSSSVYGDQEVLPIKESAPLTPKNPYAAQKLMGEMYCSLFSSLYGLETASLRYFNVYGRRQPQEGAYAVLVGIFLKQWSEGKPMTIVPDGKQSRDFTHVSDIVRANISAMESNTALLGDSMNIGTGKEYSVLEVARMIGGDIAFIQPRSGEARRSKADRTRAKELLRWEPLIDLPLAIAELKIAYKKQSGV